VSTEYLSKSDIVAKGIRTLIEDGEVVPGSVLRQRDLAERFGVSATPVREALRQLEVEGFVTTELHRGATVVRTEDARLEENFVIRAQLESLGAGLAASKITDAEMADLEAVLDKMAACGPYETARSELNREFHFRIYEAARSPVLLSLVRLLWRSLGLGPKVSRSSEESERQHRELLQALRRHDAEAAAECTRLHIMSALEGATVPTS
jgi:DNA-binding GntR family transcriptional regulator